MEKERLQKIISSLGYCSRRKAEELISNNQVKVNGELINTLGYKCYLTDTIEIDDKIINNKNEKYVYLKLNKPKYYVSTSLDPQNRKTIMELLPKDQGRLFSVGRLDYESTGLLLITNDGDFSNLVTHPSSSLEKEYIVECKHAYFGNEIEKLEKGLYVIRRGYKARGCKATLLIDDKEKDTSTFSITIHEGKKRQIRDMMMTLSHPVISLNRVRIGEITLGRLKLGDYEEIPLDVIKSIKNTCLENKKNNKFEK